jgi:hypothetical protein
MAETPSVEEPAATAMLVYRDRRAQREPRAAAMMLADVGSEASCSAVPAKCSDHDSRSTA